ncbi:DUF1302 domain-containing protein, partial [Acinetobacter sp. UBA6526]|uniref:DUF1302 domain-containing protein n=1 Tax=Acinetobacter sp. UBA6526 TaxID=1945950 RepID=UPI00257BD161
MMKFLKLTIVPMLALALSPISFHATAADLNLPGLTGTINTTITSGISIRAEDMDCKLQDGRSTAHSNATLEALGFSSGFSDAQVGLNTTFNNFTAAGQANIKGTNKNSAGCATSRTDGYGNASTNAIPLGDVNSDDGSLNFQNSGDVIDATQKLFSEISARTDSGVGINASFITSYNPVLDFNDAEKFPLANDAKDELESDFTLLDAYITTSFDAGSDIGFVDVTAGRFVTSWGEATFIPIGMNGLVTNAVDLSALRAPGASIRDALLPTEQLTLTFGAGDWTIEAYTQFSESHVEIDPKGAFFGSDVAGTGATSLLVSGSNKDEKNFSTNSHCTYAYNMVGNAGAGNTCNQASSTVHLATATRQYYDTAALARAAQVSAAGAEWGAYSAAAAAVDFGSAETSGVFSVENGAAPFTSAAFWDANQRLTGTQLAENVYTDSNLQAWQGAKATIEMLGTDQRYKHARDDGQWGLAARTYLDDIGTGVDLGFYYANYHSKAPYIQFVGKAGVLAGDHVGAYIAQYGNWTKHYVAALGADGTSFTVANKDVPTAAAAGTLTSADMFQLALANGAFGSGVCGGFTGLSLGALGGTSANGDIAHQNSKDNAHRIYFGVEIDDGTVVHNPQACVALGNDHAASTLAYLGYGATLLPAITPLQLAKYQFIYPEDIEILGMSFNTNVGGTVLQGEVAYRPNYPLAITASDQINAISDASGATALLTNFAAQSYGTNSEKVALLATFESVIDTVCATGCGTDIAGNAITTFDGLLTYNTRSSIPNGAVYSATSDYTSKAFHDDMDVWSFDVGTTTNFSASDPITRGLGADSAFLLTELGIVHIDGMDDLGKGFVARNGFVEGSGGHLCLGFAQKMSQAQRDAVAATFATTGGAAWRAAKRYSSGSEKEMTLDYTMEVDTNSLTNMGANIVDALFGNGSYCESQPGADATSATYRIVGGANYQNFNNTAWTLGTNFAWSHDFYGYGPSSLGGFVEDKQALSLGMSFSKGDDISTSLNYVMQLGDEEANL